MNLDEIMNQVEAMEDAEVFSNGLSFSSVEEADSFRLESDEEVDRFLAIYKRKQKQIIENKQNIEKAKERYAAHFDAVEKRMNGSLESSCNFLKGKIEEYVFRKLEGKPGKLSLLNGNIQIKEPRATITYSDEEAVIKWLQEKGLGNCLKISLNKAELKKATKKEGLTQTYQGEPIPGVAYEERPLELVMPNVAKEMEKEAQKVAITETSDLLAGLKVGA